MSSLRVDPRGKSKSFFETANLFAFQNVLGRERLAVVSERGKVERLADKPGRGPGLIAATSASNCLMTPG
ncbi:hypothetical protein OCEANICA350_10350 [Oceanicaulis sp. 350]|nr:hypothetical protein OCEANICA350_10350 [Oceanicaulis sp. 350]